MKNYQPWRSTTPTQLTANRNPPTNGPTGPSDCAYRCTFQGKDGPSWHKKSIHEPWTMLWLGVFPLKKKRKKNWKKKFTKKKSINQKKSFVCSLHNHTPRDVPNIPEIKKDTGNQRVKSRRLGSCRSSKRTTMTTTLAIHIWMITNLRANWFINLPKINICNVPLKGTNLKDLL